MVPTQRSDVSPEFSRSIAGGCALHLPPVPVLAVTVRQPTLALVTQGKVNGNEARKPAKEVKDFHFTTICA